MLVRENIYEAIKHLKPRSEEEISNIENNITKQLRDLGYNIDASKTYKVKNPVRFKYLLYKVSSVETINSKIDFLENTEDYVELTSNDGYIGYINAKEFHKYYCDANINESIKHLKPRSEEELMDLSKESSIKEKISIGCQNNILPVIKEVFNNEEIIKDRGGFGIGLACLYKSVDVVKYLMKIGADASKVGVENNMSLRICIDDYKQDKENLEDINKLTQIIKLLISDEKVVDNLTDEQREFLKKENFIK